MRQILRVMLMLLAWGPPSMAWAQCTQVSTLDYTTATDGDRKPGGNTTVGGTTVTLGGYSSTVTGTNTNTFAVGTNTTLPSKALVWQQNTRNATGAVAGQGTDPATVTYTFSRPVTNFTIVVADIDRDITNARFIDQMTFDGYVNATDAAPITLVAGNVTLGTNNTNTFVAGSNAVRGTNVNAAATAGNVRVTFPQPITKLVLSYENLYAYNAADDRTQTAGINSISFCSQADVYARFTAGPTTATTGQSIAYTVQFGNNGPDIAATTVTRKVTVPAGAVVTNAGGGTISGNTIDFGNVASLASGASNSFTYTYTLPTTASTYNNTATITAATTNTAYDPTPNNTGTRSVIVAAGAGACTTAPVDLDYRTRPTPEIWKNKVLEGVPATTSATRVSTTYNSADANSTFALGNQNGQTLRWATNYASRANNTSTVTYTFDRAVSNFSVRVQDIDAGAAFVDQVTFSGANNGTSVTPTVTKVVATSAFVLVTGTSASGVTSAGSTTDPDQASVVASFPNPINTLTLVYSNQLPGTATLGAQAVGIDLMSWCRLVPVANPVTIATLPSSADQVSISGLSSTVDGTVLTYTVTSIPTAAQGVLYFNSTGTTYTAVVAGQTLTAAQAASLRFDPAAGASGNVTFNYTVQDDANLTSNTTTYTIPVSNVACAVNTTSLSFAARPASEDWKNHAAEGVPAGSTQTTISSGAYTTPVSATTSTFLTAPFNGVQSLQWLTDYASTGANTSSVTFTFNRAVSNFTVRVQDIDALQNAANSFIDQVTFSGANGATVITPSLSAVNPNNGSVIINGNVATGTVNNTSPDDASVVAYFASPITTLTLTYRNTSTFATDPTGNAIGIDLMTWCQLAPVANNITNATLLSTAPQVGISPLSATADGTIASYTLLSLPTAAQGLLYVNGVLATLNQTLTPAQAAQLSFDPAATFTGPASFTYNARDAQGNTSNTATYTIPVVATCQTSYLDNATSRSGLTAEYYAGYFADDQTYFQRVAPIRRNDPTVDFSTGNGTATWGDLSTVASGSATDWNTYSSRYRGSIYIATAGSYTFYLNSDDASYMWLDANALAPTSANANIANGGQHGVQEVATTITLSAGLHDITVVFGENGGTNSLKLEYESAANNIARQVIPQGLFCAGPAAPNSPPVAADVTNQGILNSAGPTVLNPNLTATDPDGNGTLSYYNIVTIPTVGGTLRYNGVAVVAGQGIPVASIGLLTFEPNNGYTGTASFTYTVTDAGGRTDLSPNTYQIPVLPTTTVSGTIFEDVNYGGGAGRPLATAGTSARPGATVELYDASGNYQTSAITDAAGKYTFTGIGAGTYTVRVVDASVTSSRNTNNVGGLVPVQTFVRTGGTTNDLSRVGGEVPSKVDAAVNPGVATFANRLTLAQLTAGNATPQSITTVTVATTPSPVNTVDFGFNFDVITNTNDAGQGSLRQFITNANALPNTGLAQAGQVAGKEVSIFMIPDGGIDPGIRSGVASGLTAGVAVITPATALPALTDGGTSIDGTTQTSNIGNNNTGLLGVGGNVGTGPNGVDEVTGATDDLALSQTNRPEVQISGTNAIGVGLDVQAAGTILRGLSVVGFGNATNNNDNTNVRVGNVNGFLLEANFLGLSATKADFNTSNIISGIGDNIRIVGSTGNGTVSGATASIIQNNLIGYSNGKGISLENGSTGVVIRNNEIRNNGITTNNLDGIDIENNSAAIVTGNFVVDNYGVGVDSYDSAGNNVITGNTIIGNGRAGGETAGVRVFGNGTIVSQNIIRDNYGAGIQVRSDGSNNSFSLNSISGNGTVTTIAGGAASGQIGIDLLNVNDNGSQGTAPYVTKNDNGDGDAGGNGLINFPVIQDVRFIGSNIVLRGYAKPGASIEFYVAAPDGSGFGEGSLYLFTATEGTSDGDAGTGSYSNPVNGLDQGTETNQNRFSFSFPTASLSAQQLAALQAAGARITSTATLAGQGTSEFSGNVSLGPDVTTTITGPNTLLAGQPSGTFTVAFSNAGSSDASAVNQTVALPAGAGLTAAQLTAIQNVGASYSGGLGGTITFPQAATLAPGASNIYQFAFTAPLAAGTTSINGAVSTATNQGSNLAPDAATFPLTIAPVADVVATINGAATTIAAGSSATFTATFTNNGPSAAANAAPTVQLPAGLGTVGVTSTLAGVTGTYNNTTGVVTYTGTPLNSLANAATFNSVITYTQPQQGNVTATAAISTTTSQGVLSANGNPATANDSQSDTNVGSAGFDLATTLSGPSTAVAGTQITYAVTTSNNGPSSAPSAIQTVTIPTTAALTNVFLTNGGTYSFSNGTSLFTFPTIPALGNGQQVNNSISFTAPTGASAISVTSLATPNTATAGDANTGNNQVSISTNLTTAPPATDPAANLFVTIASNAPNGVAPNTPVTFTVTQGNNGPGSATNVATQVYLPTGLTGVVVRNKAGAIVPNTTTTGYNTLTGVVILPGEAIEASAITPLSYTIVANSPASGVINATATVNASTRDIVPADNVALTAVTVNVPAVGDVTTTINGPAVAYPGESIVYTVASINNGTTAATGVVETVQLPAGLVGVVVKDANGNTITNSATTGYNSATGQVAFASLASLGAGASITRTITLPAPNNAGSATGGTIVPVAMVSSTSFDNVLANNSASVSTTIKPVSDFIVALSGPATTLAGNPVTFTVTTTNNGPSIGGQQTTVQLPLGLDAPAAGLVLPTGATYSGTTGILTLTAVAAQGLGTANALTSSVTFNAPTGVVLLAPTAQVTPATGTNDVNAGNNAATATTAITLYTEATVDLATTVTSNAPGNNAGAGGTQTAGQPITFTVTATNNTAAVTAPNTVQQLSLVAGLTGVAIDNANPTSFLNGISTYASGATYNANTGVVTFAAVALANGTPVTHTVRVNAPGSGPLVAAASVKSDRSETATANNSASTSIAITPSADLLTSTTGPATTQPSTPVSYSVITTNNGPSAALNVVPTMTLPAGFSNVVLPAGASIAGNVVTFATVGSLANGQQQTNTVTFTSPATAGSYTVSSSSTSTTVGATPATADPNGANNSSSTNTTSAAPTALPVAFDVVNKTTFNTTNGTINSPSGSTAGQNLISPLSSAASSGQTIAGYTVTSIPTTAQGILYYNSAGTTYTAVVVGQPLTLAQAASLKFDPADATSTTTPVGNITFTYTATDNLSKESNAANYTIQVGQDNNSVYTATPNKGAANQYQTDDVLAFVIDPNGAAYNSSGLVYNPAGTRATILAAGGNSGLVKTPNSVALAPTGPAASGLYPANAANTLPAGVSLDPVTGLIYVSNRALLVNNSTIRYYQVNVTTTDIYGGTNVVTAQFSIGAYPLPVELKEFTAVAVKNMDAQLNWSTASEKANDHFDVERSLTGTDFVKIGQVQGQGSVSTTTAYALTDAGIGAKAAGLVYYRLKQVDTDGTASYSPVRTVSFTATALTPSISLWPNPATAATKLDLSQLPVGRYEVSILDATGRTVLHTSLEAGLAHALDLNTIASGTYVVLVRGQHGGQPLTLTKRLIKE